MKNIRFILVIITALLFLTIISLLLNWYSDKNASQLRKSGVAELESKENTQTINLMPKEGWKVYENDRFSFRYPEHWYYENNPDFPLTEFPPDRHISFFENGTPADFSFGDHAGNELFSFSLEAEDRTLAEIKQKYYPDAVEVKVGGKSAIKTSFNLYLVAVSDQEKLNIVTGSKKAEPYIDEIMNSFNFKY